MHRAGSDDQQKPVVTTGQDRRDLLAIALDGLGPPVRIAAGAESSRNETIR
jgi:hypothetical protein